MRLSWVARTSNRKTGDIPTAYVGATLAECRSSCQGCALLDDGCYAWAGLARASMGRIEHRRRAHPERYTIQNALRYRKCSARVARLGAMGDPARADPQEIREAQRLIVEAGLDGVMSYTHFWREESTQHLKEICLASCEWIDDAAAAIEAGWTPAVVLPWDYALDGVRTFPVGSGTGLICPAQTKEEVTCNECRLCWLGHPMWKARKIQAIGFLDHSRKANNEKRAWQSGKQLPMFDARPTLKPPGEPKGGLGYTRLMGEAIWRCTACGMVSDALYGEDEEFHCSSLECDLVVHILSDYERSPEKKTRAEYTANTFDKKPRRAPRPRASNKSGARILADMNARNRARVNGTTRKAKPMAKTKTKSARHGNCSECKAWKWLMAKNPDRCAGCYRAAHPNKAKAKKAGKPAKVEAPKKPKSPPKPEPAPAPLTSNIHSEVKAIGSVADAIEELNPQEVARVFGYVAMRYAQIHGLDMVNVDGRAFPKVPALLEG